MVTCGTRNTEPLVFREYFKIVVFVTIIGNFWQIAFNGLDGFAKVLFHRLL
jgi:hypothetical protein